MRAVGRIPRFRLPRRPWQALLFVALLLVLAALQQWRPELFQRESPRSLDPEVHRVARVVDGDTLILSEGKQRVRLIGAKIGRAHV